MGLLANIGRALINLDEPCKESTSDKDTEIINRLLVNIAEGGISAGGLAVIGLGLASFYEGWLGMTIVLVLGGFAILILGRRELEKILYPENKKPMVRRGKAALNIGVALGVVLMTIGLIWAIDKIPFPTPEPKYYPYWVILSVLGSGIAITTVSWITIKINK
jgi:hypothetical protein